MWFTLAACHSDVPIVKNITDLRKKKFTPISRPDTRVGDGDSCSLTKVEREIDLIK